MKFRIFAQFDARSIIFWFAAFFAMHLAARVLVVLGVADILAAEGVWPWLRGLVSDLAMAILLAFLAVWLAGFRRWLAHILLVLWAAVLAGNREYIGEWLSNMSVLDVAGLTEPAFIEGSVLTTRLFFTLMALALTGETVYRLMRRVNLPAISRRTGWALAILPAFVFLIPASPPQLWIQENIIEENLRQLVDVFIPDESDLSPSALAAARRFLMGVKRQDLKGELIVTPAPSANVIIITIESLSENILQHGWMPYLQSLADSHLHYTQYINPNITTIRGLYTQFCGESSYWGRFGRDNMVRHIRTAPVLCLPEALNQNGYRTVYMQGADLDFQSKRTVIPATGFQEVLGNWDMPEGNRFSEWGIDDLSLFRNASKKIENIEANYPGTPWMVAMMTVGTHHPYNVDPSFGANLPLRERAYRYTDQAIKSMIDWLRKSGRLSNTLVFITGDESREGRKGFRGLAATIIRNQGLLIAVTPGEEKLLVDEPFLQSDLALSIFDFAVLKAPPEIGGRSIFRHYSDFRPIAFGDYSQRAIYALWKKGELTRCRTDKWKCDTFAIGERALFDPGLIFTSKPAPVLPTRALFEENKRYWKQK